MFYLSLYQASNIRRHVFVDNIFKSILNFKRLLDLPQLSKIGKSYTTVRFHIFRKLLKNVESAVDFLSLSTRNTVRDTGAVMMIHNEELLKDPNTFIVDDIRAVHVYT